VKESIYYKKESGEMSNMVKTDYETGLEKSHSLRRRTKKASGETDSAHTSTFLTKIGEKCLSVLSGTEPRNSSLGEKASFRGKVRVREEKVKRRSRFFETKSVRGKSKRGHRNTTHPAEETDNGRRPRSYTAEKEGPTDGGYCGPVVQY